ncbi:hypothetical protein C9J85_00455 [Haloferax sp. wsp5]|nr:hypothetical protein C9J85_00455 [Haloferax sp. wsp5]
MPDIDPTEHEIAELGPKIPDVDDADELQAKLARRKTARTGFPSRRLSRTASRRSRATMTASRSEAVDLSDLCRDVASWSETLTTPTCSGTCSNARKRARTGSSESR